MSKRHITAAALAAPGFVLLLIGLSTGCDSVLGIGKPSLVPPGTVPGSLKESKRADNGEDAGSPAVSCEGGDSQCCPDCSGAKCGDDGCGGSCGHCDKGSVCSRSRTCSCQPDCEGKGCGDDGCGGSCGMCPEPKECKEETSECICTPKCGERKCGDDSCGNKDGCGMCAPGETCNTNTGACSVVCAPSCAGRNCGGDGCDTANMDACGVCGPDETCTAGHCGCVPNCEGHMCGPDGCMGSCGDCPTGTECDNGKCACAKRTECEAGECGQVNDGCGGTIPCDPCAGGETCFHSACCTPATCADNQCGSIENGCGGRTTCPACATGYECNAGRCVAQVPPPTCTPASTGSLCDNLPPLAGPVVFDGMPDCAVPPERVGPVAWSEHRTPIPAGNSATFAAAWLPEGIYIYVDVSDPDLNPAPMNSPFYCGDAVEIDIVLDGRLGPFYRWPGGGQIVVRAPEPMQMKGELAQTFRHTGAGRFDGPTAWTDNKTFGAFPRTGGYTVEALVTPSALGGGSISLSAGDRVGFAVGVNVSDSSGMHADLIDNCEGTRGLRLGQYYQRTSSDHVADCDDGEPWCTPSALCNPTLRR